MRTLQGLAADLLDGLAEAERRAIADPVNYGREGAIWALTEVCKFVQGAAERLPDPQDQLSILGRKVVLDRLALALIDLPDGTVSPIIKPGLLFNRAMSPKQLKLARGYAAAAVELLCRAGDPVEKASKFVAKHLVGREELRSIKKGSAWKAVQTWRSEIKRQTDRYSLEECRINIRADIGVAIFDEVMGWHEQLISQGKESPANLRSLAVMVLDCTQSNLSQKGPSKKEQ